MALTKKQKRIAREAYLRTDGGGFLDVYTAVEAVMKEQNDQLEKAENGWRCALDKLNECQTKRGDLIDENHRLREQASAAEQPRNAREYAAYREESGDYSLEQPAQPPAGDAHASALRQRDERIVELEKALDKIDILAESSEMLDKIPAVTAQTLRPIIHAARKGEKWPA